MKFVEIVYGTATPLPGPSNPNNGMIMGKVTTMPTENPFYVVTASDLTASNIDAASPLYKSVTEFLANKSNPTVGIWCYALSGSAEVYYDVGLDGIRDGINLNFRSPYALCQYITGVETKYSGLWSAVPSDYYDVLTGNGGKLLGSIQFKTNTGLYWVSGSVTLTGALLLEGIRADVGVSNLSLAYNAMLDKEWNCMCFAYDQSLTQPLDPTRGTDYKYASGQCIGGTGLMDDWLIGANMAVAYQGEGHACVFFAGLPSKVKTNTKMTGYALDVYSGNIYADLKTVIGSNAYFSPFVGEQTSVGYDMGIMGMALSLRDHPRMTLQYAVPSMSSQTTFPIPNEVNGWRNNAINPFIEVNIGTNKIQCIGGNATFGVGWEGDLSFVRCRDIIRNTLFADCQALLATRKLKYNLAGVNMIEAQIQATMKYMTELGYCDGFKGVTIPIKSYLIRAASLTPAEQTILDAKVASGWVDNIEVRFLWQGHIIGIIINPLGV